MRAMILAAGRGERMRPLTDHCPKPLLPVAGRSLLAWHLQALANAGIVDVVVNHAHLGSMIETALGDGSSGGVHIRYSPEQVALETAGGIARALPLLGDAPFAVINGDVFCDLERAILPEMAATLRSRGLLAWLVLVPNPAHHPKGDFLLHEGFIQPDPPAGADAPETGTRHTFSGIGVYDPHLFAGLDPNAPAKLAPLIRAAAARGKVAAMLYEGLWTDVGTPERLRELDRHLSNR